MICFGNAETCEKEVRRSHFRESLPPHRSFVAEYPEAAQFLRLHPRAVFGATTKVFIHSLLYPEAQQQTFQASFQSIP